MSASNVDTNRRKVIAYDFLYSCDQYPGASGCDDPNDPAAYDNARHGTLAASVAAGDSHAALVPDDPADGIAPGAKLIVQDGGYIGGDMPKVNPKIKRVTCPFTGEELACIPALRPDVTIIHAQKADRRGNVLRSGALQRGAI